jgi:hypothetical protein
VIVLSILLHILLLLVWAGVIKLNLVGFDIIPPEPVKEEPIVFDLQQPQKPKQVIETPDDAKVVEKQTQADYLSDKNALARNPESDPNLKTGEAFSRGDLNTHELPRTQQPIGQPQPPPQPQQQEQKNEEKNEKEEKPDPNPNPESLMIENSGTAFIREFVLKRPNPMNPGVTERLPSVRHDQQETRARDMGGLSFNTYDWDFAPYLLMLKRRIQRNIFPPAAFSQLGLISGESLIRFRIYPNGEMRNLEVLGYQGHKSLMETSYKAVEVSAPFPDLPSDFPEPFLEITGKFIYFVRRQ